MSFSDGVLIVKDSISKGEYNVPVRAIASSGDITGQVDLVLSVNVTAPDTVPEESSDIAPSPATEAPTSETNTMENENHGQTKITFTPKVESVAEIIDAMTKEEKQQVTELKITTNVKTLAGIEELTNLKSLDLTKNVAIEEVNLSGNTSIKTVTLAGNQTVKTINLTNSNVETLDASGCTEVEEVNVEGNTSIVNLDVSNTSVKEINVSGCENLEVLKLSGSNV